MIRVSEDLWVNGDHVESVYVAKGIMCLATCTMLGADDLPYTVERKYLEDVCSAIKVPFNTILGLIERQKNVAGTGGGDAPAEKPTEA